MKCPNLHWLLMIGNYSVLLTVAMSPKSQGVFYYTFMFQWESSHLLCMSLELLQMKLRTLGTLTGFY